MNISPSLALNVNGSDREGPVTPESIQAALLEMGEEGFAILHSADQTYIQSAPLDGGFLLEKREGDHSRHFQAVRRSAIPAISGESGSVFTRDEIEAAFLAYASGGEMPQFLEWERMDCPA